MKKESKEIIERERKAYTDGFKRGVAMQKDGALDVYKGSFEFIGKLIKSKESTIITIPRNVFKKYEKYGFKSDGYIKCLIHPSTEDLKRISQNKECERCGRPASCRKMEIIRGSYNISQWYCDKCYNDNLKDNILIYKDDSEKLPIGMFKHNTKVPQDL